VKVCKGFVPLQVAHHIENRGNILHSMPDMLPQLWFHSPNKCRRRLAQFFSQNRCRGKKESRTKRKNPEKEERNSLRG
jgi:hypothetical protein